MPTHFDLVITTHCANLSAEFRLHDGHGSQVAYRQTDFKTITASRLQGLFDLRNYLRIYVERAKEIAAFAEIGICIAEDVLGKDIFEKLWQSESQRTLRIQLPGAADDENHLAAALARVPWEIARPTTGQATLGERNLLVRVVHDMQAPTSQPLELGFDETLRVLFVFAEARGSRPLGARKERRELFRLFEKEIYPRHRVVAHFLTYGVTRERLEAQIQENGGYHVVHWSGHGHLNLLEIAKPGGAKDHLSGDELLDLFARAGGFLPRLVLLSACHSGDILRVKDWNDFLAVAQGKEPDTKNEHTKQLDLQVHPGFTGTAHALLQGGVPSVVAMRYGVGDDYAREMAVEFYRALLAHAQPKSVAAALTLARQSMLRGNKHDNSRFAVCDHATPVLYGAEQPGLTLVYGRSPELNPRNPRLNQITEMTTAAHEHFVGRTWELAGLGADFIGPSTGEKVSPVAVIIGLGGMGKTALVAEALSLWETRFEWVLLYQAKPNALGFEATLRDIHLKLMGELGRYYDYVKARPAEAIYREGDASFTGPERLERLTCNLFRALKDESILLVLDNFETNLKATAEPAPAAGPSVWACQDPMWDRCLSALANELASSPSRVLITCRHSLAALADGASHAVLLGPLPSREAALYLTEHPALSRMVFGGDGAERALAFRLLNASRFHPLLMDRLARLAGTPNLRPQALQALDTLEKTKDFQRLPALFASSPGDAKEIAYLEDALGTSLDQLIRDAGPDARRLLWMTAVANEPVTLALLKGVWGNQSQEEQRLRKIKQMLEMLSLLPQEVQEKLRTLPPEIQAKIDSLPPEPPEVEPLLRHLVSLGLATEERTGPENDNREFTCHELIRERIRAWMEAHPGDRSALTENNIRLAYAEQLVAAFKALRQQNRATAVKAGSSALAYCVQAQAWDRLSEFAGSLINSISDPKELDALIPYLRTAADSAPEGRSRWTCLLLIADALDNVGQHDVSLPFYEMAATHALLTVNRGGELSQRALSDLGVINGNWGVALEKCGQLNAARRRQFEAAAAHKKAGDPSIEAISRELEAARIDISQGAGAVALPRVEAWMEQLNSWWEQYRSNNPVPDVSWAPHRVCQVLSRALQVAAEGYGTEKDWASAVRYYDALIRFEKEQGSPEFDVGLLRMSRANILRQFGRDREAKDELEACVQIFRDDPVTTASVLSSLADLFAAKGDQVRAIELHRRALVSLDQSPTPLNRAIVHGNLAICLDRCGIPSAIAEASSHSLAALLYRVVTVSGNLQISFHNYRLEFRRAHAGGTLLTVPRVAELLADPAFYPLQQWLRQSQVDLEELQITVDEVLNKARLAALGQS